MSCGKPSKPCWYNTQPAEKCGCTLIEIPTSSPVLLATSAFSVPSGFNSSAYKVQWTLRIVGECPVTGTNQFSYSMTGGCTNTQIPPFVENRFLNRTPDGNTACWNLACCPEEACLKVELLGTFTDLDNNTGYSIGPFNGCATFCNCNISGYLSGDFRGVEIYYTITGSYKECREGCMRKWCVRSLAVDGRIGSDSGHWNI